MKVDNLEAGLLKHVLHRFFSSISFFLKRRTQRTFGQEILFIEIKSESVFEVSYNFRPTFVSPEWKAPLISPQPAMNEGRVSRSRKQRTTWGLSLFTFVYVLRLTVRSSDKRSKMLASYRICASWCEHMLSLCSFLSVVISVDTSDNFLL